MQKSSIETRYLAIRDRLFEYQDYTMLGIPPTREDKAILKAEMPRILEYAHAVSEGYEFFEVHDYLGVFPLQPGKLKAAIELAEFIYIDTDSCDWRYTEKNGWIGSECKKKEPDFINLMFGKWWSFDRDGSEHASILQILAKHPDKSRFPHEI